LKFPKHIQNEAMTETVCAVCDLQRSFLLSQSTVSLKEKSITVTTGTFPANQSFTVKMGYYAAGAPAAHHNCGGHDSPTSYPWYPWMDPDGVMNPRTNSGTGNVTRFPIHLFLGCLDQ
jgi:hypothetical protein